MLKKLGPENQMGPLCIGALVGLRDIIHQYMYMLEEDCNYSKGLLVYYQYTVSVYSKKSDRLVLYKKLAFCGKPTKIIMSLNIGLHVVKIP